MIDTLSNGRPARQRRNGTVRILYPCASCKKNLVTKEGGLCKACAAQKREENYKAHGIKHSPNLTYKTDRVPKIQNRTAGANRAKSKKDSASCPSPDSPTGAHFQRITTDKDGNMTGECIYCHRKFQYPSRDRGPKKQRSLASNRRGGDISGALRGGRRGRPRKIRADF